MPLDPVIAGGVRPVELPDPLQQYARISAIQNAQNQNALAQMQMQKVQRDLDTQNAMRQMRSMPGTLEYVNELARIDPAAALAAHKEYLAGRKQQVDADKARTEVLLNAQKFIAQMGRDLAPNPTDANVMAWAKAAVDHGVVDWKTASANAEQLLKLSPQQRSIQLAAAGADAEHALKLVLPNIKLENTGGAITPFQMNPAQPGYGAPVAGLTPTSVTMTPFQTGELAVSQNRLKLDRDRFNWTKEQADNQGLAPEAVALAADYYVETGGKLPPNMGRNGVAARQVLNEVAKRNAVTPDGTAPAAPVSGASLVATSQANVGKAASERTLGTTLANVTAAASEAGKMIDIADTYVTRVDMGRFKDLNSVEKWAREHTGDKEIAGLNTALNSLVNAYARAINPRGVATVSDKQHAREIVDAAMAKGQIQESFAVMRKEMAAALAAPREARTILRDTTPGKPAASAASGVAPPPGFKID